MPATPKWATGADPDDLALATLAALQGGLLLAQVQRDPRPLEVALTDRHLARDYLALSAA